MHWGTNSPTKSPLPFSGFPTSVENMDVALQNLMEGFESIHGVKEGGLKVMLKNAGEEVHLLVNILGIPLQAHKFTKNKLLHRYFSRIAARF